MNQAFGASAPNAWEASNLFTGARLTMPSQKFPGKMEKLRDICAFVMQTAVEAGFSDAEQYAVELAVDEACTNIIEHAYQGEGKGEIRCITEIIPQGIKITLIDQGKAFDPHRVPMPNPRTPLAKLKGGGAGLFLMRKMMDEVKFEFSPGGGNTLIMIKHHSTKS